MSTVVPVALHVVEGPPGADAGRAADGLRDALHPPLAGWVAAAGVRTAQVFSPLLGTEPLVVHGAASQVPATRILVQHAVLPQSLSAGADLRVDEPAAGLLVATANKPVDIDSAAHLVAALLASEHARVHAVVTAHAALELASRDIDTGLGNRRAWLRALKVETARVNRHGRPLVLLVLDLDGLKEVNDTQGHDAGDRLIARTAELLHDMCRTTDTLCRIGGDEFGIIAPDTQPQQVDALVARFRSALERQGIGASAGAALCFPGGDAMSVWRAADEAMYRDKAVRHEA